MKKIKFSALIFPACFLIFPSCATYSKSSSYRAFFAGSQRYSIIRTAEKYIGVRYKFGGDTPRGFDCSGYTKYIYQVNGIDLPHSARQQYSCGKRVGIKNARPGDLVFFRIHGKKITHVGVYAGNYRFIHAPRRGKRVSYDDIRKDYWRKRYAGTVAIL